MNILDQIIANKRREIEVLQQQFSIDYFRESENFERNSFSLSESVVKSGFGIIAEIKRKSPSGGAIKTDVDVAEQVRFYEDNGACGISVLTDNEYFGGSLDDIIAAREAVNLPILRKEFILDEIQLYEAKAAGADAVLLIAAVLTKEEAGFFTLTAQSLGLEVVFEVHTTEEFEKIPMHANLLAVNNRDLKAQQTTLQHSFNLVSLLPGHIPFISASGIKTREDITALKDAGFSGALIGESILRDGHLAELTKRIH